MRDTPQKLTDALVKNAAPNPARANWILYEKELRGFGLRTTRQGAKAFILNYRIAGSERRLTIGSYPAWSVPKAREEAARLKREIDCGRDPLAEKIAAREAPTVDDLADRFLGQHAAQHKRERSRREDESLVNQWIRPELGRRKVADIRPADIDALHHRITVAGTPVRANRAATLLSTMFSLAVRWEMRSDNPVKGLRRNPEEPRRRYLAGDELRRPAGAIGRRVPAVVSY